MKKKTKIIVGIIALLFVICWFVWRFMPVRFLRLVESEEIAVIEVFNGNNGNEFEITDPEDIFNIVSSIKQVTFRKKTTISDVAYWYRLTFIDENGEEIDSLAIQNHYCMRKNITSKREGFFFCNGELGEIADYLEKLESIQFPDYKKDPDSPQEK